MGTFMSKHSNLLKYMPVDDKASALNHNSFPVHEHPHSVKGKSYTKEIKDLPSYTKEIKDLPKKGNITKNKKPIDGSKDVVKL